MYVNGLPVQNLQTPVTIYVNTRLAAVVVRKRRVRVCAWGVRERERRGYSLINIERGRDNFN